MKMNRKFVGILFCIVLGIATFSFLSGVRVGRSEFAGVGDSIPKGNEIFFPFSYLIDKNSTHYFLGNGTSWKWDYISTNASKVREFAYENITASGRSGTIFFKTGDYNFGANPLILKDGRGTPSVSFIGETKANNQGVVWIGNGKYMVTTNRTASPISWVSQNGAFHSIKNIRFEHTTKNSSAVTINLEHVLAETDDVWIGNVNATQQGTGIRVNGTGNAGFPWTWKDLTIATYAVSMEVASDHLTITGANLYDASEKFLYWHGGSAWTDFYNLQVTYVGATSTAYLLYLSYLGQADNIFGLKVEAASTTFNQDLIYYITPYHNLLIDGFFGQGTLGNKDATHAARFWVRDDTNGTAEYYIRVNSYAGNFKTEMYGSSSSVINGQWISHTLLNQPYFAIANVKTTNAMTTHVSNFNATKIQIYLAWTNGTAVDANHSPQTVEWFATVNRE